MLSLTVLTGWFSKSTGAPLMYAWSGNDRYGSSNYNEVLLVKQEDLLDS